MIVGRRGSIGLLAALGLSGAPARAAARRGQIVHHVFFWLRKPGDAADRDALVAGLRTLRAIPGLRELRIATPAATERRPVVDASWDVSELMVFDTVEDQRRYQEHPVHKAFVARCEPLWDRVKVYDGIDV